MSVAASDITRCIDIVSGTNPKLPFIFQPMTEPFGISQKALTLIERDFFPLAKHKLHDVRVIPQMHKIWGVR